MRQDAPRTHPNRSNCAAAFVVALVVGLLVGGCASTQIVGFVDPAYTQAHYDRFITYAAFKDLGIEAAFERAMCQRLRAGGRGCTTMLSEAPPTRAQNANRRQYAMQHSGAQATILIELADTDSVARKRLSDAGPRFRVSLLDNANQQIVARFAVHESAAHRHDTGALARRLASAVVRALRKKAVLTER